MRSLLMFFFAATAAACSPSREIADRSPANAASSTQVLVARLQTALPTIDDRFVAPPGSDDPVHAWRAWAIGARPNDTADIDAIARLMQEPLVADGNTILQAFHNDVRTRIAIATCSGNRRAIFYSPEEIVRVGEYVFDFIRHHELGHHRLGQIDCSAQEPFFLNYNEKDADCWAADSLTRRQPRGRDVLFSVAQLLFLENAPGTGPYPPTSERARYLRNACGRNSDGG